MATQRMYDLAFAYKKTKLWKNLYDTEIFAVKLSDGEIGYCSIMGMNGGLNAVALYVGAEGFQSYRDIAGPPSSVITSKFEYHEFLLSQNCLQCIFDNKDALNENEIEEVRAYAKAHGISLRGTNAFAQFVKYQPYRHPWEILTDTDQQRICEALEACLALSEMLQGAHKQELGILGMRTDLETFPMLERENDHYTVKRTVVPPEIPVRHPTPKATNDISIARIKKLKKKCVLECGTIRMMDPVQEHEGDIPYYPLILLAVDAESGIILPLKPVLYFEEHPQMLLEAFEESLLEYGACPRAIKANDARTFALLQDLCKRAGIRLTMAKDELPALEDAKDRLISAMLPDDEDLNDFENDFEDNMLSQVIDTLMYMSDSELKQMPREVMGQLLDLANAGALPPELKARLKCFFRN